MYPSAFGSYKFEELATWRTRILADLQEAEQRAIDAGVDPQELNEILSIGIALGKVDSEIQNHFSENDINNG